MLEFVNVYVSIKSADPLAPPLHFQVNSGTRYLVVFTTVGTMCPNRTQYQPDPLSLPIRAQISCHVTSTGQSETFVERMILISKFTCYPVICAVYVKGSLFSSNISV